MFPHTFCSLTTALTAVRGQKFSAVPNLSPVTEFQSQLAPLSSAVRT